MTNTYCFVNIKLRTLKTIIMEIKNENDVFNILKKIQQKIDNKATDYHSFRFEISFNNKTNMIEIKGRNSYIMKSRKGYEKPFVGQTMIEAMQNFVNYFTEGGRISIKKDENGNQFSFDLGYQFNDWEIENLHIGRSCYQGR